MSDASNVLSLLFASNTDGAQHFVATLAPANNSGAHGVALLTLRENSLTVDVAASGLEPGQPHPFHIHGFEDDRRSQLPTIDQDTDLDGFVESAEGTPVFGPVLLALSEEGPPADSVGLTSYPVADTNGDLAFTRTFDFDPGDPEQAAIFDDLSDRLDGRGLQFHGLDLPDGAGEDTENEVNGTGGYIAGLPVANGIIHELPSGINSNAVSFLGTILPDIDEFLFG